MDCNQNEAIYYGDLQTSGSILLQVAQKMRAFLIHFQTV
jgi:hypothetical protein